MSHKTSRSALRNVSLGASPSASRNESQSAFWGALRVTHCGSVVRMRHGVSHFFVKLGNNISLFFYSFFDCIIFNISSKKQWSKNSLCECQRCHGKRQGVRHETFHEICHWVRHEMSLMYVSECIKRHRLREGV